VGVPCDDYEHGDAETMGFSPSGYINWIVNDTLSWGLKAAGLEADSATEIGTRPIPTEPMVCPTLPAS
jgi:hypothetical protein